jgi:hypothetical protein
MRLASTRCKRLAAAVLILSLGAASSAAAHDEGVLKPATRRFAAGDSVSIAGEKFTPASTLELFLVGVGGRIPLPGVTTDARGGFSTTVLVPADVTPGAYRLVAVADDGDEVTGLDVSVAEAAPTRDAAGHVERGHTDEASDVPLKLVRARSSMATGASVALIAISVVFGLGLLRFPARL